MTRKRSRTLHVFNGGLLLNARHRRILDLAGWPVRLGWPGEDAVIGVWGRSPTARRAAWVARRTGASLVTVEDAFLRSALPARAGGGPAAGLLIDETGVHFDGRAPSDLERLLAETDLTDPELLARAEDVIARLRFHRLGKYTPPATEPPPQAGFVLVIDQTQGDASLLSADDRDFRDLLARARAEHPDARILIRSHPESTRGARPGHFGVSDLDSRTAFAPDCSLAELLERACAVYVHSSQAGFDAIFHGHRPFVAGLPFFAGWGLSRDANAFPRRRKLTAEQLVAGALIRAPYWYDPTLDRLCEVEDVISNLAAEARAVREDAQGWTLSNIRAWKRPWLRRAFGGRVFFAASPKSGTRHGHWGDSGPKGAAVLEDGFIRSIGLGAALVPPVSLTLDPDGPYFDPGHETGLDRLIAGSAELSDAEIRRVEELIARILALGLTKYDISSPTDVRNEKLGVLVIGQVPGDASVRFGAKDIVTDDALLAAARARHPEAHLIWKPHPDVLAGLRPGANRSYLADEVLGSMPAAMALARASEVWTITSTMGFEACLRGLPVICAGMPFYAGWGLTRDLIPAPSHRRARPTLLGLAHAALIGYPRYFDPRTGRALSPEAAVELLALHPPSPRPILSRLQGLVRRR